MKLNQKVFENILIFFLVAGCTLHPASCAAGLLILAASQIAERYFTRNVLDKDRQVVAQLKAEVEKVTAIQQKEGLAKAFGGQR